MPTVNWRPPRYVVVKERPNGRVDFFFSIPAKNRPDGWPPTVRLPKDVSLRTRTGAAAELAAVEADAAVENEKLDRARSGVVNGQTPGTIPWLIARWQTDDRYAYDTLSRGTKNQYDMAVRRIMLWHDMQPFSSAGDITWPDVVKFLDAFHDRRGMLSLVRAVLRQIFDVGKDFGYVAVNPFAGEEKRVTRRKQRQEPKTFKLWTAARLTRAVELCDAAGFRSIGTAIMVGFDMMQYPATILPMRRGVEYKAPFFAYRRSKTDEEGVLRASMAVQERLKGDTLFLFICETTGKPWNRGFFNATFRRIMDQDPETEGLLFKHLRHCGAAEARRAGASWDQIADIGAWKSVRSAEDTISQVIDTHYRIPDYAAADGVMSKREALRAEGESPKILPINPTQK